MPCKEPVRTLEDTPSCTVLVPRVWAREAGKLGRLSILRTNRRDVLEPYWQDETDWLCAVEFLPTDDPEARLFAADIIGYLCGYAHPASSFNEQKLERTGLRFRMSIWYHQS